MWMSPEVHIYGHSWGTTLAVEYMFTKRPKGVRSLILASPCLSAKRWVEDAEKLIAELPQGTQETIRKNEEAGTTDSKEYKQAVFEYIKRHVCRLDPWPEKLADHRRRVRRGHAGSCGLVQKPYAESIPGCDRKRFAHGHVGRKGCVHQSLTRILTED